MYYGKPSPEDYKTYRRCGGTKSLDTEIQEFTFYYLLHKEELYDDARYILSQIVDAVNDAEEADTLEAHSHAIAIISALLNKSAYTHNL